MKPAYLVNDLVNVYILFGRACVSISLYFTLTKILPHSYTIMHDLEQCANEINLCYYNDVDEIFTCLLIIELYPLNRFISMQHCVSLKCVTGCIRCCNGRLRRVRCSYCQLGA